MRNSLDARDGVGVGKHVMLNLFQSAGKELVGNAEYQAVGILHDLHEIRNGNDVLRKLVAGKIRGMKELLKTEFNERIFDVLVLSVNNLREFTVADHLLVHPHLNLVLKASVLLGILS